MSICERCPLFLPEEQRCKVGRVTGQLFCNTYNEFVAPQEEYSEDDAELDKLEAELQQLENESVSEMPEVKPEVKTAARKQIGRPDGEKIFQKLSKRGVKEGVVK